MNQILMVENKKKKKRKKSNSGPVEIRNIVIFFSIVIIIFGISLIGQGSYAIYKESKGKNTKDIPVVNISRVNDTAIVSVNSTNKIMNLKYSWNTSEETVIPIENTYAEEEIILPNENSILYIVIEEETGRAVKYEKEFIIEGIDITKPKINIDDEQNQGNIKITATDDIEISYITYKVNDEDDIRIDKTESENKTIQYILKLERGENKIIVKAVDISGNTEKIEKTIIVSELPTMELMQNAAILTATIRDTDGIKDIEINLNGVVYAAKDVNQKAVQIPLTLKEGTNTIKIKVTNINGLVAEGARELNYAH